jgi:hypothetical protein
MPLISSSRQREYTTVPTEYWYTDRQSTDDSGLDILTPRWLVWSWRPSLVTWAEFELGTSFIININYFQLLSGTGEPILESKLHISSYIPMNWILHIRTLLIVINATLKIQNLWLPKLQWQNDRFLMETFVSNKETKAELNILNNWRLYYKVLLYSELCYTSGQGIQPIFLEYHHERLVRQSASNLKWPVQNKPDERSFKIWKRCIKLCFKNSETKQASPLAHGTYKK